MMDTVSVQSVAEFRRWASFVAELVEAVDVGHISYDVVLRVQADEAPGYPAIFAIMEARRTNIPVMLALPDGTSCECWVTPGWNIYTG